MIVTEEHLKAVRRECDKLRAELAEARSKSTFRSAEVAFRDRRDLRCEVDDLKRLLSTAQPAYCHSTCPADGVHEVLCQDMVAMIRPSKKE